MVYGTHYIQCIMCGNYHMYGDAIAFICPECKEKERKKKEKKKKRLIRIDNDEV